MKCPSCGAESDGGRFCAYCGSELPQENAQSIAQTAQNYNSNNVSHHVTNVYYINQVPAETFSSQIPMAKKSGSLTFSEPANTNTKNLQYQENNYVNASHYPEKALVSDKSKGLTLFLCFFLGWIGIHHFYTGRWKKGLLYFFTGGLFGIGWIIDLITILCNSYKDSQGLPITGGSSWMLRIIYLIVCFGGCYSLSNSTLNPAVSLIIILIFGFLFLLSFRKK